MTYQLTSRAKFWLFVLSALVVAPFYADLLNALFPANVSHYQIPYGILKTLSLSYAAVVSVLAIAYGLILKEPKLLAGGGWFLGLFLTGRGLVFFGENELYLGTVAVVVGLGVLLFVGNAVFPFRAPPAAE